MTLKKELEKNHLTVHDIDRIYVTQGPGSFTGIRVGVTIAKTLAYGLKAEIVPISKLELLATTKVSSKYVVPYIDARRGYVFSAIYDENLNAILEDQYISMDALKEKVQNLDVSFVGISDLFPNTVNPSENVYKIWDKYKNTPSTNVYDVNPKYLKKTEAEEKNDSFTYENGIE